MLAVGMHHLMSEIIIRFRSIENLVFVDINSNLTPTSNPKRYMSMDRIGYISVNLAADILFEAPHTPPPESIILRNIRPSQNRCP